MEVFSTNHPSITAVCLPVDLFICFQKNVKQQKERCCNCHQYTSQHPCMFSSKQHMTMTKSLPLLILWSFRLLKTKVRGHGRVNISYWSSEYYWPLATGFYLFFKCHSVAFDIIYLCSIQNQQLALGEFNLAEAAVIIHMFCSIY